jgi:hypothetical protein
VVWEVALQGDQELDLVFVIFLSIENLPRIATQSHIQGATSQGQAGGLPGVEILGDAAPELGGQGSYGRLPRRPIFIVVPVIGFVCIERFDYT